MVADNDLRLGQLGQRFANDAEIRLPFMLDIAIERIDLKHLPDRQRVEIG